jgi:prepilin-type N-terminal cleavage/methylation domain-containing protein
MQKIQKGFTLIELLIVIAVLGVLAVAVLSAINPIEQINRSRDTAARSDAEQLISAIDRYYAAKQVYPWNAGGAEADDVIDALTPVQTLVNTGSVPEETMLESLSDTEAGTGELKSSFVTRITALTGDRQLYIFRSDVAGASEYVCFIPQSGAFNSEAKDRWTPPGGGNGQPADVSDEVFAVLNGTGGSTGDKYLVCLP